MLLLLQATKCVSTTVMAALGNSCTPNLRPDCAHLATSPRLDSSLLYPRSKLDPALHQPPADTQQACRGLSKAAILGQMGLGLPQPQEGEERGICWVEVMEEKGIHRSTAEASSRLAALGTGLATHTLSVRQ